MNKTVLITGAAGFLGRHLQKKLADSGFSVIAYNHSELDITDTNAVRTAIAADRPDYVVHCAAISSTAYAKEHPEQSYAVNVQGCINLALACQACSIPLFLMSSDQVYGGCGLRMPLPEVLPFSERLSPNNVYGEHKLLMEDKVLEIMPEAVIFRLSWMYESYNPENPHTDIVSNILKALRDGSSIKCSTGELRGITYVDDVCDNIVLSFDKLPGGVYNFGSSNNSGTFETMSRIAAATGLPKGLFIPDDSWSRNLSMDCSKVGKYGIVFRDTETALRDVIQTSPGIIESLSPGRRSITGISIDV